MGSSSSYPQSRSQVHGTQSKRGQQLVHKLRSFSREENFYFIRRLNNPSSGEPVFASANDLLDHSMNALGVYRELHLRTHGCLGAGTQSGNYVRLYFGRIWTGFTKEFTPPRFAVPFVLLAEALHSNAHGSSHAFI